MDDLAALRHLVTTLEGQVSRQCGLILTLQRDLAQVQDENRRLAERLSAREVPDVLAPDVDMEPPESAVPTPVGAWPESVEAIFATHRRHN